MGVPHHAGWGAFHPCLHFQLSVRQFVSSSVGGQYASLLFQNQSILKNKTGRFCISYQNRLVSFLLCDALWLEPHDARAYSQGGAQCGENGQQALHHKFPDFLLTHSRFVSFLFYVGLFFLLISFLSLPDFFFLSEKFSLSFGSLIFQS